MKYYKVTAIVDGSKLGLQSGEIKCLPYYYKEKSIEELKQTLPINNVERYDIVEYSESDVLNDIDAIKQNIIKLETEADIHEKFMMEQHYCNRIYFMKKLISQLTEQDVELYSYRNKLFNQYQKFCDYKHIGNFDDKGSIDSRKLRARLKLFLDFCKTENQTLDDNIFEEFYNKYEDFK